MCYAIWTELAREVGREESECVCECMNEKSGEIAYKIEHMKQKAHKSLTYQQRK